MVSVVQLIRPDLTFDPSSDAKSMVVYLWYIYGKSNEIPHFPPFLVDIDIDIDIYIYIY